MVKGSEIAKRIDAEYRKKKKYQNKHKNNTPRINENKK